MIVSHTQNFCICKISAGNREFYFLNEYKNGKPTTNAGEMAGKYYSTLEDAENRLQQRQAAFDNGLNNVKNLI